MIAFATPYLPHPSRTVQACSSILKVDIKLMYKTHISSLFYIWGDGNLVSTQFAGLLKQC